MDPLETGEGLKNAALLLLEANRLGVVAHVRRRLVQHLVQHGMGTIDDARAGVKLPDDVDPKCMGAVPGPLVKAGIIRRKEYRRSVRSIAHARPVSVWSLAKPAKAAAWLAAHPERPIPPSGQTELSLGENEEPGRGNAPANH